jgi:hypothetical protein
MPDAMLGGLLLTALVAAGVLYWLRVVERVHERRVERRIADIRHVAATVRASFAQQRGT